MSLAEELAAAKAEHRVGTRCGMGLLIDELGDEGGELVAALADGSYAGSLIGGVLRNRGHKIGDSTVQRHRKGKCSCPKETP